MPRYRDRELKRITVFMPPDLVEMIDRQLAEAFAKTGVEIDRSKLITAGIEGKVAITLNALLVAKKGIVT